MREPRTQARLRCDKTVIMRVLPLWAALCLGVLLPVRTAEDAGSCAALGFTGLQLCSDCRVLGEYVKDEGAMADRRPCKLAGPSLLGPAANQKQTRGKKLC